MAVYKLLSLNERFFIHADFYEFDKENRIHFLKSTDHGDEWVASFREWFFVMKIAEADLDVEEKL